MTEMDIILERDTANDESASVIKVFCVSGSAVVRGQLLFEIENSKATQEIESPIDGAVVHALAEGDEVALGLPIARIVPLADVDRTRPPDANRRRAPQRADAPPPREPTPPRPVERPAKGGTRPRRPADRQPVFSKAAAQMLADNPVDPDLFTTEFVTAADVLAVVSPSGASEPYPAMETSGESRGAALSPRKRAEIRTLESGAGSTMLSVLGVNIGAIAHSGGGGDSADAGIADLIIYEASRLMRRYENLNAHYLDGRVVHHAHVSAGLAIDGGGRLVVYGIEDADTLELGALRAVIDDAVARYLENTLSASEMARATFTVTDLSAEPLDFVLPLLPAGQSCIIGVTRNARNEFSLHVGFDHRVTEGREVSRFLGELRRRLQSFGVHDPASGHRCSFCERTAREEVGDFGGKGLIRITNADGVEVLSCMACLNGW